MRKLTTSPTRRYTNIAFGFSLCLTTATSYAACNPNSPLAGQYTTDGTLYYCGNVSAYEQININTGAVKGGTAPLQGFGIYEQGSTNLKNVTITTGGSGADGIRTLNGGVVNISDKLVINISGSTADGINAITQGATRINIGDNSQITVKGGVGVRANVSNSSGSAANIITLGKNSTILTQGSGSNLGYATGYGVYAGNRDRETLALPQGFAQVVVNDGSIITTSNNNAHAVYANKKGQVQLGNTSITTTGQKAHGIVSQDGTVGKCPQGGVSEALCLSIGSNLTNITPYTGGQVYLTGNTTVTVDTSKNSYAIYSSGENSMVISGDLNGVEKSGNYVITGNLVADRKGQIELRAIGASEFTGDMLASNPNTAIKLSLADSSNFIGNITALDSAQIDLHATNVSEFTGDMVASNIDTSISMNLADSSGFTGNITASDSAQIDLRAIGASEFTGDMLASNPNTAINLSLADFSSFTGNITALDSAQIEVLATDASQLTGNMLSTNADSLIKLNVADTSRYTGNLVASDFGLIQVGIRGNGYLLGSSDAGVDGTINIAMDGENTKWQMINSSNVTNLDLNNKSQVILGDNNDADLSNRVILDIENLRGNGKFFVRANILRDGAVNPVFLPNNSDVIRIHGTAQGEHEIFVRDSNLGNAAVGVDGTEILRIVETLSTGATFKLAIGQPYVDVGPYKYLLDKEENLLAAQQALGEASPITPVSFGPLADWSYWSLGAMRSNNGGDPNPPEVINPPEVNNPPGSTNPPININPPDLNNTAQSSINILNSNYLLGYVENQTMLQRMGELRAMDVSKGNAWSRFYGGRLNSFDDKRLSGFNMNYTGMQLGIDRKIQLNGGEAYVGIMGGYTKGDASYKVGNGSSRSYHVGLYGAYKADNGLYIDGIAKYSRMNNKFSTLSGGGYAVNGDGITKGYSIGLEVGKRFYIQNPNKGWYIEPQTQITHAHQGDATILSSNGLKTELKEYNSTLGRVSLMGGYSIAEGENPVEVYFITGIVKEFEGKTGYIFNHKAHENFDFVGIWWENRIGVNAQFRQRHNAFLDVTYSKGSRFNNKQANLGYRYQF